jgi:uncharacterized LabA/DUF88 family protein
MKYAILIDGGFLKRKLDSRLLPIDATRVSAFLARVRAHDALFGMSLHRVYWYDAPPLDIRVSKPLRGGRVNFGVTPLAKSSGVLLDQLSQAPYMSIRRGEVVFRGWKVRQGALIADAASVSLTAADLIPNIQQKGVDMRLGLDIAALTLKAQVDVIVLVTGDSDFVPAMKFARREGAQVFLVSCGHALRPDMREHSDLLLELESHNQHLTPEIEAMFENVA